MGGSLLSNTHQLGKPAVSTSVGVGVMRALVLARHRVRGALWWAVANPHAWALAWPVTSYVIARNIDEWFPIFGASGALVFGLLTWLLLAMLFRAMAPEVGRPAAPVSPTRKLALRLEPRS